MLPTFGEVLSTVKGDSSFGVPSSTVQVDSALPGAGVLLAALNLLNVKVH